MRLKKTKNLLGSFSHKSVFCLRKKTSKSVNQSKINRVTDSSDLSKVKARSAGQFQQDTGTGIVLQYKNMIYIPMYTIYGSYGYLM